MVCGMSNVDMGDMWRVVLLCVFGKWDVYCVWCGMCGVYVVSGIYSVGRMWYGM